MFIEGECSCVKSSMKRRSWEKETGRSVNVVFGELVSALYFFLVVMGRAESGGWILLSALMEKGQGGNDSKHHELRVSALK